jgi:hypothetical protein
LVGQGVLVVLGIVYIRIVVQDPRGAVNHRWTTNLAPAGGFDELVDDVVNVLRKVSSHPLIVTTLRRVLLIFLAVWYTGCGPIKPTAVQATGNAIARAQSRNASITEHAAAAVKLSHGEAKYHAESIAVDAKAQAKDLTEGQSDLAAVAKQLASALSANTKTLRTVQVVCVIGIGGLVALGLFTSNFKLPVIGIVSAVATAGAAQAFITFDAAPLGQKFWLVLAGVGVVCGLWVGIEAWARGSFSAAIRSNPIRDIEDLFNSHAAAGGFTAPAGGPDAAA